VCLQNLIRRSNARFDARLPFPLNDESSSASMQSKPHQMPLMAVQILSDAVTVECG
jgi:hypothetical protein